MQCYFFSWLLRADSTPLLLQNENKFKCPCHGSQYNREGKKVRGPAPLVSSSTFGSCLDVVGIAMI